MFKKSIILLFYFLLFSQLSFPQKFDEIDKYYTISKWTTENGLPQNSINDIFQSEDGFIWLLTYSGFSRFDGITFTNFNSSNVKGITGNRLIFLYPINKNDFLVREETGKIIVFENNNFTTYKSIPEFKNYWIRSRYPNLQYDIEKYSIFITNNGVVTLKTPQNLKFDNKDGLFFDARRTKDGRIWIVNQNKLYYLNEKESEPQYIPSLISEKVLFNISDQAGNLWLFIKKGKNDEFVKYDEKSQEFNLKDPIAFYESPSVLNQDYENSVWVGTFLSGIVKISDKMSLKLAKSNGMDKAFIKRIVFDKENNIWVGTNAEGLFCFRKKRVTTISARDGLSYPVIQSIHQDNKNGFWICTNGGGLDYYSDGKISNYSKKIGIFSVFLYSAFTDSEKKLWIGIEDNSVIKYSNGRSEIFKPFKSIANNFSKVIFEDSKKRIWLGTETGLACYEKDAFITYSTTDGLVNNSILSIYEDKSGAIWIGTNGGISCLKNGAFYNLTSKDGLQNEIVRSIYQDDQNTMWFGTYGGGLYRLKNEKLISIKSENGLFDDVVHNIIEDKNGRFWMSCNRGIFFIPKKDLYDFTDGKIRNIYCISLRKSDGMLNDECNGGFQPSACLTKDNKIFYPTINGIAVVALDQIKVNEIPPQVVIERFLMNQQSLELKDDLELPPGGKNFEIGYTGLSFTAPEKIKFKYKLEGYDQDWMNADDKRVVSYTHLPPGHYRFRVIACNGDGIWNNQGASIRFYLKPGFFETWYFYLFLAVILFASGFGIKWFRDANLRKRKDELEEIVKERTQVLLESNLMKDKLFSIISHDLRGPLGSVNSTLEIVENEYSSLPDNTKLEFINTARKLSENVYSLLDELLSWARKHIEVVEINRKLQSLDDVIGVNISLLSPLAKTKNIVLRYVPEKSIKAYFDRDTITTVIRNLISNGIKYTKPGGEVRIEIKDVGDFIEVKVIDSGIGISLDKIKKLFASGEKFIRIGTSGEKGSGYGLLICKDFVVKNGGKIWANSGSGNGSEFIFTLPKT